MSPSMPSCTRSRNGSPGLWCEEYCRATETTRRRFAQIIRSFAARSPCSILRASSSSSSGRNRRYVPMRLRKAWRASPSPVSSVIPIPLPTLPMRPSRKRTAPRQTSCARPPSTGKGMGEPTRDRRRPMAVRNASRGILSDANHEKREQLIEMLKKAYWMEIETVMSYIANSINPDGVRAQEIIESLQEDIQEELGHAQQFASRIKELYGVVPGSLEFKAEQAYLQPPEHQTDVVHVIKGVIEAETGAIEHSNAIIEAPEGTAPVTNDMLIAILRDEEGHRRLFEGYLREYEAEGLA